MRRVSSAVLCLLTTVCFAAAAVRQSAPPAHAPFPVRRMSEEEQRALKIGKLLGDLEVAYQLVQWTAVLALGGVRFAMWLTGELLGPLARKTVAVVELRGVIADDRAFSSSSSSGMGRAGAAGREWYLAAGDAAYAATDGILSVSRVEKALERAFKSRRLAAVVVHVSSPGGTVSESALLYRRVESLKRKHQQRRATKAKARRWAFLRSGSSSSAAAKKKKKPSSSLSSTTKSNAPELLAFVDDVCTSGGYYVACAADAIVAAPCAIVGSIGVISSSFGFAKQLKKQGIERRIQASGSAKADMDPFTTASRDAVARQRRLLDDLHLEFVATVATSRGSKLKPDVAADLAARADGEAWPALRERAWVAVFPPLRAATRRAREKRGDGLFDGSVYTARTAKDLGLIDAICEDHIDDALRARYGNRIRIKRFRAGAPGFLSRFAKQLLRHHHGAASSQWSDDDSSSFLRRAYHHDHGCSSSDPRGGGPLPTTSASSLPLFFGSHSRGLAHQAHHQWTRHDDPRPAC